VQVDFIYPDLPVGSVVILSGEFDDRMLDGEFMTGISTSMAIFTGTISDPSTLLVGSPSFSGNTAYQSVQGLVAGNIYTVVFFASTSAAHLYQKVGRLAVIPAGSPY
jgi:hypothetical protein